MWREDTVEIIITSEATVYLSIFQRSWSVWSGDKSRDCQQGCSKAKGQKFYSSVMTKIYNFL